MVSLNKSSQQIQMSILPTHIARSDAPDDVMPGAAPVLPAPATGASRRKYNVGRIVKQGLIGTSLIGLGTAIGAASVYAALDHGPQPTPAPRANPLDQQAAQASAPVPVPALPPSSAQQVACIAPTTARNITSTAALLKPSNTVPAKINAPLFAPGGPVAADIAGLTYGPTVIGNFGAPGTVRASALTTLAQNDPQFIENMIREITPDTAWAVRLYDRDEASNNFLETLVRVDIGELDPQVMPVYNDTAMWWAVVLQAGQKLDGYTGFLPSTVLPGDQSDAAATRRQAIESIIGANVEIVSGDELDALRTAELDAIDPTFMALINGTSDELSSYDPSVLDTGARLLRAKNDNWPSLLARMADKRNLCMVNFHDNFDIAVQNLATNSSALAVPSGANLTLNSGGAHWASTDTFVPVNINVPGQNFVMTYLGAAMPYVVIDGEPDAVWLQRGPAIYSGWPSVSTPFKVPMDLVEAAGASVTIARRPCESDSGFLLPGLAVS